MPAPIRPGRGGDEKQFQSGEVESFTSTLLATSISLLLAYFSLVFPVGVLRPLVRAARMPPPPRLPSNVPFSPTYCANNSNVATTAILERHGALGGGKKRVTGIEDPEGTNPGKVSPEAGRDAEIKLTVKLLAK